MKSSIDSLVDSLKSFLGDTIPEQELEDNIRVSNSDFGDLSFPCHRLATALSNDGEEVEIAQWLSDNLDIDPNLFEKVENRGAFVNFFLNKPNFVHRTLSCIHEKGQEYGHLEAGHGKKVVVDYSAPNIGKPLHIGHIRSTILGDSVIKILQKAGYETHGINYLGDIGLHLGKVILSYQKYVDLSNLEKHPEKELLRLYVKFGKDHEQYVKDNVQSLEKKLKESPEDEDLEQTDSPLMHEAKEILKKIEQRDPQFLDILKTIYDSSMRGFDKVYGLLGVSFDEITGQSKFSEKGKELVQRALEMGVAEVGEKGVIVVNKLKEYGLPPKGVLRSDGTAIYSTQDIGAAFSRYESFSFDQMIYVVAEEQNKYFEQMFKVFELFGGDWAKTCYHLSFGMINLAEEKMSSRKGNIIFLEDVLNQAIEKARSVVKDNDMSEEDKEKVAKIVGIGAIKYMVLGIEPVRSLQFSWENTLNLNAHSSPYIQYSYTRANSLTRLYNPDSFDPNSLLDKNSFELIKKLSEYPLNVKKASQQLKPNIISNYCYDLAKNFTRFYHSGKILGSEQEQSKLYLVNCFRTVIEDSMGLLGIDLPDRM
jgi:arginyl-tRNA synthetase